MSLSFSSTDGSVFAAWDIFYCVRARSGPGNIRFHPKHVLTSGNFGESHLSPVFTPTVTNDPVILASFIVLAESNNRDNVIGARRGFIVVDDTSFVIT
jgi:hypothetical protein